MATSLYLVSAKHPTDHDDTHDVLVEANDMVEALSLAAAYRKANWNDASPGGVAFKLPALTGKAGAFHWNSMDCEAAPAGQTLIGGHNG